MGVTVKEQQEVESKLLSLTRQRQTLLPDPGNLTDSLLTESDGYLSILPVSKTEKTIKDDVDITRNFQQSTGPANAIGWG